MIIGCNIRMICLKLNGFFYDPSWMSQLSEFVSILRSSVWVVFNNFLLIDSTDRSKISSDQKRLFCAVSLYPLSFFANTPFKFVFILEKKNLWPLLLLLLCTMVVFGNVLVILSVAKETVKINKKLNNDEIWRL